MFRSRIKFVFVILVFTLVSVVAAVSTVASPQGDSNVYLALIESAPDLDATPTATIPPSTNTPTATTTIVAPTNTPTATTTTIPSTSTPTATATTVPSTCTIFEDDFSDPTSGWPIRNEPNYEAGYDNGEYRWLNKIRTGYGFGNFENIPPVRDFSVSVDMHWESTVGNSHGIYLDGMPNSDFTTYDVWLIPIEQKYFVGKMTIGEPYEIIIPETVDMEINPNNETNRLTVTKSGNIARIIVNGIEIDSFPIEDVPWTTALWVSTNQGYGSFPAATRFDNFCLTE